MSWIPLTYCIGNYCWHTLTAPSHTVCYNRHLVTYETLPEIGTINNALSLLQFVISLDCVLTALHDIQSRFNNRGFVLWQLWVQCDICPTCTIPELYSVTTLSQPHHIPKHVGVTEVSVTMCVTCKPTKVTNNMSQIQ